MISVKVCFLLLCACLCLSSLSLSLSLSLCVYLCVSLSMSPCLSYQLSVSLCLLQSVSVVQLTQPISLAPPVSTIPWGSTTPSSLAQCVTWSLDNRTSSFYISPPTPPPPLIFFFLFLLSSPFFLHFFPLHPLLLLLHSTSIRVWSGIHFPTILIITSPNHNLAHHNSSLTSSITCEGCPLSIFLTQLITRPPMASIINDKYCCLITFR